MRIQTATAPFQRPLKTTPHSPQTLFYANPVFGAEFKAPAPSLWRRAANWLSKALGSIIYGPRIYPPLTLQEIQVSLFAKRLTRHLEKGEYQVLNKGLVEPSTPDALHFTVKNLKITIGNRPFTVQLSNSEHLNRSSSADLEHMTLTSDDGKTKLVRTMAFQATPFRSYKQESVSATLTKENGTTIISQTQHPRLQQPVNRLFKALSAVALGNKPPAAEDF